MLLSFFDYSSLVPLLLPAVPVLKIGVDAFLRGRAFDLPFCWSERMKHDVCELARRAGMRSMRAEQ